MCALFCEFNRRSFGHASTAKNSRIDQMIDSPFRTGISGLAEFYLYDLPR